MTNGTIEIRLSESGDNITVRIPGIRLRKERDAKVALLQIVRERANKPVSIMMNPSDWAFRDIKPKKVVASITLQDGSDLGLLLISSKIAHFREPSPYKMSRNLACRYRVSDSR
jgi:hypothetical protein